VSLAVSSWLLTAVVRFRIQASPWIYGGQSGTETGICSITSVFRCQYRPTSAKYSFIHSSLNDGM